MSQEPLAKSQEQIITREFRALARPHHSQLLALSSKLAGAELRA